jgi:glutamyl-tRNA(Gln) amidotransferase subunit E
MKAHPVFSYDMIYKLFGYISSKGLQKEIAEPMLRILYQHPKMRYESILTTLKYRKISIDDLTRDAEFLYEKFKQDRICDSSDCAINWLMGQLRKRATGNIDLSELKTILEKMIRNNG